MTHLEVDRAQLSAFEEHGMGSQKDEPTNLQTSLLASDDDSKNS